MRKRTAPPIVILAMILAMILALAPLAGARGADPLTLSWPVDCQPGATCWIVNYMDHDDGPGFMDYRCGPMGYDGHKGTDIAIRESGLRGAGVTVRAAAAGTVVGMRDGLDDVDVRSIGVAALKGKACGNGARIDHGGGWTTQYCHLRKGSLRVAKGDRVADGQALGMVGLSGKTTFPHLHIQVERDGRPVDPFAGPGRADPCRADERPLWADWSTGTLAYVTGALATAGFATTRPKAAAARAGLYDDAYVSNRAPMMILWVDTYWTRKGDLLRFTVRGPDGETVLAYENRLEKSHRRRLYFAGRKKPDLFWRPGAYTGTVTLSRPDTTTAHRQHQVTTRIQVR